MPKFESFRRRRRLQTHRKLRSLAIRPEWETLERLQLLSVAIFDVTTAGDNGDNEQPTVGSLRAAILSANSVTDGDSAEIDFQIAAIPGSSVTIQPNASSPLPTVSRPTFINGFSEGIFQGTTIAHGAPRVVIDGSVQGMGNGLTFGSMSAGSRVEGLSMVHFDAASSGGAAIYLESGGGVGKTGNVTLVGNYLGVAPDGVTSEPNVYGIEIATSGNTIGGNGVEDFNLVSGNLRGGILLSPRVDATGTYTDPVSDNVVVGNRIGTTADGMSSLPNGGGLDLAKAKFGIGLAGATGTTIAHNVITTSSLGVGVDLTGIAADLSDNAADFQTLETSGNLIRGNWIGVDLAGTAALGNRIGVLIASAAGNTVGGVSVSDRNIISGSQDQNGGSLGFGVAILGDGSMQDVVMGNAIGTDASEQRVLPNSRAGVLVGSPTSDFNNVAFFSSVRGTPSQITIGGPAEGAGNLISGNLQQGITLQGSSSGTTNNTLIQNNRIGTFADGSGSTTTSGNQGNGIETYFTNGLVILGNTVQDNQQEGILVTFSSASTIGARTEGAGNVVAANGSYGIELDGSSESNLSTENRIEGNKIGTFADGSGSPSTSGNNGVGIFAFNTLGLVIAANRIQGNSAQGIYLYDTVATTIGGPGPDAGNVVAANGSQGIYIDSEPQRPSPALLIQGNSIGAFGNGSTWDGPSGNQVAGVQVWNTSGLRIAANVIAHQIGDGVVLLKSLNATVGGAAASDGNLITANSGSGIDVEGSSQASPSVGTSILNNTLGAPGEGNGVGTFAQYQQAMAIAGNLVQHNGQGLTVLNSSATTLGGSAAGAGNIIAANQDSGINILGSSDSEGDVIAGNFLGVFADGIFEASAANGAEALHVGSTAAPRITANIIQGGKTTDAVVLESTPGLAVLANTIQGSGVLGLRVRASQGGTIAGNRIALNLAGGLGVEDASDLAIQGNLVDSNGAAGIALQGDNNVLGGTTAGAANRVTNNAGSGIVLTNPGSGNQIRQNAIAGNGGPGIDLGNLGIPLANDSGPQGPNHAQNYPVLSKALVKPGNTSLTGTFQGAANTNFILEFFSNPKGASSFAQGEIFIGSANVTTDAQGLANFNQNVAVSAAPGSLITATATSPDGDTSEFSPGIVALTATTTTLDASPRAISLGQSLTLTAQVSASGSMIAGTVSFYDGVAQIGSATVDSDGAARLTAPRLAVGTHAVLARYAPSGLDAASQSEAINLTVDPAATAVVLSVVTDSGILGQPLRLTAVVSDLDGSAFPSGDVTLLDDSTVLGTASVASDGTATWSILTLSAGFHALNVRFADPVGNFAASHSQSIAFSVQVATSTALTGPVGPTTFGQTVQFVATVAVPPGAEPPTGVVSFRDGAVVLGNVILGHDGTAMWTTAALSVGPHTIQAFFDPEGVFLASDSPSISVPVQSEPTAVSLSASSENLTLGQSVIFTASLAATEIPTSPSGTFTFFDGENQIGTTAVDPDGQARLTMANLQAGSHSIRAIYSGDGNFLASESASRSISVTLTPVADGIVAASASRAYFGQSVTLNASFSASSEGSAPLTGTVAFYDGDLALGTATLTASAAATDHAVVDAVSAATVLGQASLDTSALVVGDHAIRAVYSGDAHYASATTTSVISIRVDPALTSTTLAVQNGAGTTTLTATTVATTPGNPTISGTVSFFDGDLVLGNVATVEGVAVLRFATPTSGAHSYRAEFSGSAGTAASTSEVVGSAPLPEPTPLPVGAKIIALSRFGIYATPTTLALVFDQPLDPIRARDVANYRLLDSRNRLIPLIAAHYDDATRTVTLSPNRRLGLYRAYTLMVSGRGLTSADGVAIDGLGSGQIGSNFSAKITWAALAAPGLAPALTFVDGRMTSPPVRFAAHLAAVVRSIRSGQIAAGRTFNSVHSRRNARASHPGGPASLRRANRFGSGD